MSLERRCTYSIGFKYSWRAIDKSDIRPSIKAMMKLKMLTGMHMSEISNLKSSMFESNDLGDWIIMPVGHHKNSNYENMIEHKIWLHLKLWKCLSHLSDLISQKALFYGQGFDLPEDKSLIRIGRKSFKPII